MIVEYGEVDFLPDPLVLGRPPEPVIVVDVNEPPNVQLPSLDAIVESTIRFVFSNITTIIGKYNVKIVFLYRSINNGEHEFP